MSLALGRHPGEAIILTMPDGSTIKVAVSAIHGQKAILAIDAPKDVKIVREELLRQPRDSGECGG